MTDQREHFPSITDAAEAFDTCPENIIRAINTGGTAGKEGRRRRWAYGDEPLPKEWLTNPRIADDGGPANQRAVVSDQGELFNSLTEAADAMGVSDKAIAKAAGNDGRSAGRRWYFTTDYRSRPYVLMALRTRVAPVRIA